jgi:hypothetical protein
MSRGIKPNHKIKHGILCFSATMSDIDAYAEELVNVFGFSFPLPPVYLNARPDSEIYSHPNLSLETITPARYAALSLTNAPALPAGQARRVRFDIPIDQAQEELSDEGFWVHYPRIIPGGINTEYVSLQNIINSFFLSFSQACYAPVH